MVESGLTARVNSFDNSTISPIVPVDNLVLGGGLDIAFICDSGHIELVFMHHSAFIEHWHVLLGRLHWYLQYQDTQ